jgi:hypothetical protein
MDSLYPGITNIGSCGDTDKPETGGGPREPLGEYCGLPPRFPFSKKKKKKTFRLHASLRTLSLRRKIVPN